MYNTETISVNELLNRMRAMKVGEEITLIGGVSGLGIYGIRSLPGGMFDNGKCWLADYYGGGATAAFSEDSGSEDGDLYNSVLNWLDTYDLLTEEPIPGRYPNTDRWVSVAINKYSEPESVWEFKEVKVEPKPKAKNRIVVIEFSLADVYRTPFVVPPDADDDEIVDLVQEHLCKMTESDFKIHCTLEKPTWDPQPEDFVWMDVLHMWDKDTDQPVGFPED